MSPPREALEAAYRATSYLADGPLGRFAIRIGQPSPEADVLLDQHRVETWAFVTACNPGSEAQLSEVNEQRHLALVAAVKDHFPSVPGEGRGDGGDWPAERSLLLLGIRREEAVQLARQFGQLALVFGQRGGAAELVWTE
jgi:hypothetical protein